VRIKVVNALTGDIMFVMLELSLAYVQEILTSDAVLIAIPLANQMKMSGARETQPVITKEENVN